METHLSKERVDFLEKDFECGFIAFCRFKAQVIRRGYFQSKVNIDGNHRQQDGFIHAGVMATLSDHTGGYAAFTTIPEDYRILTIEFKINLLRPAYGNALVCKSNVIREGRQIIISESDVYDIRETKEVLASKALVTLMAVHQDKVNAIKSKRHD